MLFERIEYIENYVLNSDVVPRLIEQTDFTPQQWKEALLAVNKAGQRQAAAVKEQQVSPLLMLIFFFSLLFGFALLHFQLTARLGLLLAVGVAPASFVMMFYNEHVERQERHAVYLQAIELQNQLFFRPNNLELDFSTLKEKKKQKKQNKWLTIDVKRIETNQ